ncbi:MAG: hypothetical protein RIF32_03675, partial [Leptospirales bacterium]
MDALYKIFDRFSEMIPPQLLPVIRLGAILVWVVLAGIVAILAWGQGSESAPQMGQELSLAEIKARQQREANLQKPQNVRIPDLNELIPERPREPVQYESPALDRAQPDRADPMLDADSRPIEPRNPVHDPLYQGESLAPRGGESAPNILPVGPGEYRPAKDAGVGGVREEAGGNSRGVRSPAGLLPLDSRGSVTGLDGKPLRSRETGAERETKAAAEASRAKRSEGAGSGDERTRPATID